MRKRYKNHIYIFTYAYIRNEKKKYRRGGKLDLNTMKTFFSESIYKNLLTVITSRKQVGERRVWFWFFVVVVFSLYTFLHCWNFLATC